MNTKSKLLLLMLLFLLTFSSGCIDTNGTQNASNESQTEPELSPRNLNLSDISTLANENTLIAVQDGITFLDYMSALRLQNAFPDSDIIQYSNITDDDRKSSNIVVMGNRNSNTMFGEVYNLSYTISENRTFQGEGNGSIEIITNPWNSQTNVLLVEGYDSWGVRAASKFIEANETDEVSGNYTEVDYQFTQSWTPELEEAAIEKAEEIFADETQYEYDSTVSEKSLSPLFYEYFEGYEVYSATSKWDGSSTSVSIVVSPNGTTFGMWSSFPSMFEFEKPVIDDETNAIEVSGLYLSFFDSLILVSVSEIPHESPSGENPANYQDIVKPPCAAIKNNTYNVELHTWGNGILSHWSLVVGDETAFESEKNIVSYNVGDSFWLE
ncbi:hypothetical protein V7O61_05390 [Methanolobus sp. WCC1]|uniref:hypothetical protein n=1 Tax=unclassified Methanolobus TaxID=2629569 RepID=UPI0032480346